MKRKLLFAAALLAGAVGFNANAQTAQDVTDTYLINPSFETLKAADGTTDVIVKTNLENGLYGWDVASLNAYQVESEASGSSSGFLSQNDGPITPSDGTYYYFNKATWRYGSANTELKTTTKADVETGKYYLVFDYKAADYSNNDNWNANGTTIGVTVKTANDKTIGTTNAVKRAYTLANNGSNTNNNSYMQTAPWTQLGVYFEVEEASKLTFTIQQNMKSSASSDIAYDNFKLYKIDGAENVNLTGLIANPSFETGNFNEWTVTNNGTGWDDKSLKITGVGDGVLSNSHGTYILNNWNANGSSFNASQTIAAGLPAGKYQMSAVVASDGNNVITLYAGTKSNDITAVDKSTGIIGTVDFDYTGGNVEIKVSSSTWFKADNFQLTFVREFTEAELLPAAKEALNAEITIAKAIDTKTNVGNKVFQIPTSAATALIDAITNANTIFQNSQSLAEVEEATTEIKAAVEAYTNVALNAPDAEKPYTITLTEGNDKIKDHAVEFVKDGQTAAQGTYAIQYNRAYNANLAIQHFYFKAVEGVNIYNIWFVDNDGEERYICDGTVTGAGTGAYGIRTTTDKTKALPVKVIASETNGITYMINTKADNGKGRHLGSNGDAGMYSWEKLNDTFYKNFSIEEAAKAEVDGTLEAGKYATRIYPFVPKTITGVKFYSCEAVNDDSTLDIKEVTKLEANKPYILYNETAGTIDITDSDYGTLTNVATPAVKDGLLTGVYTEEKVGEDNYVLQTQEGVQAFYQIAEGSSLTAVPYRAYLTVPEGPAAKPVYYFDFAGDATAIEAVPEVAEGTKVFYNLAGQRVANPTKGIYIVNGQKVLVK